MLENMSEEQLRGMAAAMPGAAGMQVGPAAALGRARASTRQGTSGMTRVGGSSEARRPISNSALLPPTFHRSRILTGPPVALLPAPAAPPPPD